VYAREEQGRGAGAAVRVRREKAKHRRLWKVRARRVAPDGLVKVAEKTVSTLTSVLVRTIVEDR
jgi:hypothetical protein